MVAKYSNSFNSFILAAGFGERLKPLTDYIPKPLVPILGKPIIEIILKRVMALHPAKVGINLHYKADEISDYLKKSPFEDKITVFYENPILGTGGALKNARDLLRGKPFLVYNSDIFSDINLTVILEHHLSNNNLATLAVHDYPEYNKIKLDGNGLLTNVVTEKSPDNAAKAAFMGIAVYSQDFLDFLDDGYSSVVTGWMNAVSAGKKIYCLRFDNHNWSDIGSPSAYASTVLNQLNSEGEAAYIHQSAKFKRDTHFSGYLVVEQNSVIERGSTLKNCILMPQSHTKPRLSYENSILGNNFTISLEENIFTGQKHDADPIYIGHGGSNRKYFRIKKGNGTAILMQTDKDDPDFDRQIKFTSFFCGIKIPVPRLIEADYTNWRALFEDFGSVSLYTWLKVPRSQREIETIYKKALDPLLLIHIAATKHIGDCPELGERIFDYEHLIWEANYFIEMFVKGVRNIPVKESAPIFREFHMIALRAGKFKKTVIHRDFQSQNIMVRDDGSPGIIDYQGARIGPPAYDIAAFLWDPYHRLDDGIRNRLLAYYMNKLLDKTSVAKEEFLESLMICRLQRHMQALGAYGFLANVRGKRFFLKHVPEGLRLLKEDAVIVKNNYPELYKLTLKLL
jgi:NDP-sugar pyrophosphorylase family protein